MGNEDDWSPLRTCPLPERHGVGQKAIGDGKHGRLCIIPVGVNPRAPSILWKKILDPRYVVRSSPCAFAVAIEPMDCYDTIARFGQRYTLTALHLAFLRKTLLNCRIFCFIQLQQANLATFIHCSFASGFLSQGYGCIVEEHPNKRRAYKQVKLSINA